MKQPFNCYWEMTTDELIEEIREASAWDGEMLEALSYRLGVDTDGLDCDETVEKIRKETGIDLY